MNVGAAAIPFEDLSAFISNGKSTGPEPAVSAIASPKAVFRFVHRARFHAEQPVLHGLIFIALMHIIEPAKAARGTRGGPGVIVKTVADVISRSIRLPAENNIRRGTNDGIKLLVFLYQLHIQPQQ